MKLDDMVGTGGSIIHCKQRKCKVGKFSYHCECTLGYLRLWLMSQALRACHFLWPRLLFYELLHVLRPSLSKSSRASFVSRSVVVKRYLSAGNKLEIETDRSRFRSSQLLHTKMSRQDKATTERNTRTLREFVKRPENKVCADCKKNGQFN